MARKKVSFMGVYDRPDRRYDPTAEGYGSPSQWRASFNCRMGFEKASQRVGQKSPLEILGIFGRSVAFTMDFWKEIKSSYRKLVLQYYPEQRTEGWNGEKVNVGDNEKFLEVQAAFEVLENLFKRKGMHV